MEAYTPPPNPAKVTDSRFEGYRVEYGNESWELDALDPATLDALIDEHILALRDDDLWEEAREAQENDRVALTACSKRWLDVCELLEVN